MLTFDQDSHTYRWDGQLVPGVTRVLEPLQNLKGVPWEILDRAREFGVHVHLACHLFDIGRLDERSLDPALAPYLAGWKAFLLEQKFVVVQSEVQLFNEFHRFAGTPDKDGLWRGTPWVIDIKSGVIPDTVGAQTGAYEKLLAGIDGKRRRRGCVQLTGGAYPGYKFVELKDPADFALFTSALGVYRFISRKRNIQDVPSYDAA